MLEKYKDVFEELGYLPGELHLEIDASVPPIHVPRKLPLANKAQVKKKKDRILNTTVLAKQLTSLSAVEQKDWISSMVVVTKTKKLHICIDQKNLLKTEPDRSCARAFSVSDANDRFHQVRLDKWGSYLTFWTPFGRYRWQRLPFGISSAPEEYQLRQKQALDGLEGVPNIADNILCVAYGDTWEETTIDHDKNLECLLQRCLTVNLKLNKEKARLRISEVQYMGHLLSTAGVRGDPDKIRVIQDMPEPTCA